MSACCSACSSAWIRLMTISFPGEAWTLSSFQTPLVSRLSALRSRLNSHLTATTTLRNARISASSPDFAIACIPGVVQGGCGWGNASAAYLARRE